MGSKTVTLNEALRLLADCHTRSNNDIGFVVDPHPGIELSKDEYRDAWRIVRDHLHMQTEPRGEGAD